MSKSTHQIAVKAVDQTAKGFASIKSRAVATAGSVRSMMGSALAAAGAYLGFSAIKGGIDQLGHLSDVAMKTSTSVNELTAANAAMSALGIQNMSVEQLAKSFDYMAKTTGRSGMAGFYETINELGKIPDVATRGQEAMRIFGRSGMEFMPLINAADTSVDALKTVVAAMPAIPQAAANAGDAMSDAMGFAANQVKSIWLQGLGAICGWFENEYTGGVREASLRAGNYLEYYTKLSVAKCISWYQKFQQAWSAIGSTVGAAIGAIMGGGGLKDAWNAAVSTFDKELTAYDDVAKEIEEKEEKLTESFIQQFKDREIAIAHFQKAYEAAAVSISDRENKNLEVGTDLEKVDSAMKDPSIRNEMILGASNESNRLAALGPQTQEAKKQTKLLKSIESNTKKTADESSTEEYGVIGD